MQIQLSVSLPDASSSDDLDEATRQIRDELSEVEGVQIAEARGGEAPEGTRSGEVVTVGSLIATLATSGVLTALIAAIKTAVTRYNDQSVVVTIGKDSITIKGRRTPYDDKLIDEFLRRHARK